MNVSRQALGAPAPGFDLAVLAGGRQSLDALLAGAKGAVLVFWSSVCSHCRRYDAYLNGFAGRHPEIALAAIACRQGETAAALRASVGERGLGFPILLDPERRTARRYQVEQTPRVFLLDGRGRIRYRGAIDNFKGDGDPAYEAYLEPALAAFAAGREVARPETASFGCPIESVYYSLPTPRG